LALRIDGCGLRRFSLVLPGVKGKVMEAKRRVPVSERAILDRLNRRLLGDRMVMKICRRGPWLAELGRFYIVCTDTGELQNTQIDLRKFAECLGVLHSWEFIADERGGAK